MNWKIIIPFVFILSLLAGCASGTPMPTATAQPTVTRFPPTESPTPIPLRTATAIPSYTPTSAASVVHYMFVLDASARMNASFDGGTKWDAARAVMQTIMAGLEPTAQFGLVTLGASAATGGTDPCNEPTVARTPFSARSVLANQVEQIKPVGVGSLNSAFGLAQEQFDGLPANIVRVYVVIASTIDDCLNVDEWSGLEKQVRTMNEADVPSRVEFIVLNQSPSPDIQRVTDRIRLKAKNVSFQFPTTNVAAQEAATTVLANLGPYVTGALAALPTVTVPADPFTSTPDSGVPTNTLSASSFTLTPKPGTATFTPTVTSTQPPVTFTATRTPSLTPTATATLASAVELKSYTFVTTGVGCQIDIVVKVTGSPAAGRFHVLNAGNGPQGDTSVEVTLPVGTYNNNQLTLSGNTSELYSHEIWFEYNGVESNHLKNLVCPLLPTATPTP